ncbi:galactose ABC transporter substrate-binding protein [Clostridium sp. SHJSY1]|uniref:galactose ABC transporter substrate-binding protein n=1 Tax=Clostridium sp. SHJSY1 TaxID=2942483 RepID=UPI0028745958|nr:galactose ABC transporter substrate-binding protein [Clostridium sp. SHJSY1]MDS0525682.1 galactose ABC transporter substrate-binding protein [Clostridium sp. SHJSY1]
MKVLKKILSFTIIFFTLSSNIKCYGFNPIITSSNTRSPVNVAVLLYSFDYLYNKMIQKDLEDIQKDNPDKVKFTFFDGKGNPDTQSQIMKNITDSEFDLFIFNIGQKRKDIMDDIYFKLKQKNLPLIFFNSTIPESSPIKYYSKVVFINIDYKESSIMEGRLIVDEWKNNKLSMDKNGDGKLQYIMLQGRPGSRLSAARTKYPILTINEAGIETQELASISANWDKDLAKNSISSAFLKYGNNIEAIIANDDTMAIGAVEALQQYGYNKGNKLKYIPVFGADGTPEAKYLVKEGFMTGTVSQETKPVAKALYDVGMNLVSGKNPTVNTNLTVNDQEIAVPITYEPYTINSNS